jgi:hypothetical protein
MSCPSQPSDRQTVTNHPKDPYAGCTSRFLRAGEHGAGDSSRPVYADGNTGPSGRLIPLDPDAMLDEAEAAFLCCLSPRSLQALRWRGGGPPYVKLGKRRGVRYQRGDLLQWLAERRRTSTSDPGRTAGEPR